MAKLFKQPKHKSHFRRWVIGGGVLLLVAVGGLTVTLYLTDSCPFSQSKEKSSKKTKELSPDELDRQVANQQKEALTKSIQSESDSSKKAEQQVELATIYYNEGDYQQALEINQQAESSQASAASAAAIADAYFALKNYKQAAQYYGLAMERSEKPASRTERAPYNDYLNMKSEAEAKL